MLTLSRPVSNGERNRAVRCPYDQVGRDQCAPQRGCAVESRWAPLRCCERTRARGHCPSSTSGSERNVRRPLSKVTVSRPPMATGPISRAALAGLDGLAGRRRASAQRPRRSRRAQGSSTHSRRTWSTAPGHSVCVRRRVHDPEGRRCGVTGSPGGVRVQRVALVQQRGNELIERHRGLPCGRAARLHRRRTLGRPCEAR